MSKSIHIYESKNNTITALLKEGKETIKNTIVKCHPKDEYNFNIGAKIALDRLIEEEYFKPYLKSTLSNTIYGNIGEETNLKAILGIPLKVGDIVKIYKNGKEVSKNIVAKHFYDNKYFIMGFWCYDFINGMSDGYKILFYKSHTEIKKNCTLYDINYVIKE